MYSVPTVFVIGAGAGFDIGMPLGEPLSRQIGEKLKIRFERGRHVSGDTTIWEAMGVVASFNKENANDYRMIGYHAGEGIIYSKSIDGFLYSHRHDKGLQTCGKLAILQTILESERSSAIYIDERRSSRFVDPEKVHTSWFNPFMYGLVDSIVVKEDLGSIFKNVTIVNFNYDRCIEHFLYNALQAWSRKRGDEIAELLQTLKIYHPYGSIGPLPWQSNIGIGFGDPRIAFGEPLDGAILARCVNRIRTFNEEVEDQKTIKRIRQAIIDCRRLVFLGFHFHKQNVELLKTGFEGPDPVMRQAYATTTKRSTAEVNLITERIRSIVPIGDVLADGRLDCSGLFQEYGTVLAL